MNKTVQRIKYRIFNKGFTLVELLVVIAIIGVLATIGITSFMSSQTRSRDAQRKSDLRQIANALELFYSDYEIYPSDNGAGLIEACLYVDSDTASACTWGVSEFRDMAGNSTKTTYFKVLPDDPRGTDYYYVSTNNSYELYAKLENTQDQNIQGSFPLGGETYNFAITSTNTTP